MEYKIEITKTTSLKVTPEKNHYLANVPAGSLPVLDTFSLKLWGSAVLMKFIQKCL